MRNSLFHGEVPDMRYTVTVKPNARKPRVEVLSPAELRVHVDAPPVEGKANKRLIALLAEHFGVAKSRILLLKGENSRRKLVEISEG